MFACMDASLKNVCTASLGIMYTSWVENRLLAYIKVSNLHSSNPSLIESTVKI